MQRVSAWTDLVTPLGDFRYGSLVGGQAPTPLKAEWLNMVQGELVNFILAYLPALDASDNTQLLKAARALISNLAQKETTLGGYGITDAYTKNQTDFLLSAKANWGITLADYGIGDAYTKGAADLLLAAKANNATTLGGYGIADAYNVSQIDTQMAAKQDKNTASFGTDASWFRDSATGYMEQIGMLNMLGGANIQTIPFPVAFPTACRAVSLTNYEDAEAENNVVRIRTWDRFGVTIENSIGNSFTAYSWIAKGN